MNENWELKTVTLSMRNFENRFVLHEATHVVFDTEILGDQGTAQRSRPIGFNLRHDSHEFLLNLLVLLAAVLFAVTDVLGLI